MYLSGEMKAYLPAAAIRHVLYLLGTSDAKLELHSHLMRPMQDIDVCLASLLRPHSRHVKIRHNFDEEPLSTLPVVSVGGT